MSVTVNDTNPETATERNRTAWRYGCAMPTGRRLLALLAVCAAVALPAGVLRATCAAKSCDQGKTVQARVPFCPLPDELKTLIANGYYEGRSPDVIGVGATPIAGGGGETSTPWPAADPIPDVRVPLAFLGTGVDPAVALPEQLTLDRIAPTLTEILGVRWKFPDVHDGLSITGLASGDRPRLVLEVVWTGGGTSELEADPAASAAWRHLTAHGAVASTDASPGSLPLDPVAALTTIGAGSVPAQHGITGGLIRDDRSDIVQPWSEGAPTAVIASLPDDLVAEQPGTKVGAVLPARIDQGVVGGTWYGPGDVADVTIDRRDPGRAVDRMLASGFGADDTPDVLAVVIGGPARAFADAMRTIVPSVREAVPATTVVVTATGSRSPEGALTATAVAGRVNAGVRSSGPIVEATVPGGLFLDQDVLAADGLSSGAAVQPMLGMREGGRTVFADAFPGFAVSFARYC
jgi:hypothetical protein